MRRTTFGVLSVLMVMALFLTGCGSVSQAGATVTGGAGSNLNADYTDALPVVTQLVVGTFKLDQTDLAVTADQAKELIPLWQAYRTLETSQTAAQQERDALLTQIEETMTADQMKSISDMKLTAADMQTVFRGRNPQLQGTPDGTRQPGQRQFTGQPGAGGQIFVAPGPGGFSGGGGGFGGGGGGFDRGGGNFFGGLAPGQTPNPEAIATLRATRGGNGGFGSGLNPGLINVLIVFLQQKAAPAATGTPTPG